MGSTSTHTVIVEFLAKFEKFNNKLVNKVSKPIDRLQKRYMKKLNKTMTQYNVLTKKATRATSYFKMELLGVMFGARMVAGALFGLLKPSFDLVGIFDILNTTLGVTFLPTAMAMVNPLIAIMQGFLAIPAPIREFIGLLTASAAAIFALLGTQAALNLFIPSLIKNLGGIAGLLNSIKAFGIITLGVSFAATAVTGQASFAKMLNDMLLGGLVGFSFGGIWGAGLGMVVSLGIDAVLISPAVRKWFSDFMKDPFKAVGTAATKLPRAMSDYIIKQTTYDGGVSEAGLLLSTANKLGTGTTNNQYFQPSVVVNANSNVNIEQVKQQLNNQWAQQFASTSRGR